MRGIPKKKSSKNVQFINLDDLKKQEKQIDKREEKLK